ncbi:MAG: RagB/SusD family nutrient uptake outer membrane protein, partial [Muribaculaceae bacterium]|nr:RagB/SusD family nutrient uptake outer membrane protein [Muribaculaceae bacterium]
MKLLSYITALTLGVLSLTSCTDLDETVYDQVSSGNYYNTRNDVIRAVLRPFEHGFWSIQSRHVLNELSADQLITPSRDGWWDDGGVWRRYHYHTWNVEEGTIETEWNGCFQGIMQANYVIDDLQTLSADSFGFTEEEFNNLKAQCRVLRAWFYIRLLAKFRNVPLANRKDV